MISDQRVRIACQTNFQDHITLEAGAGSGKTATLIARILHWILKEGWGALDTNSFTTQEEFAFSLMHRVVAITFTEAAAEEMVERLGGALIALSRLEKEEPVVGFSIAELGLSHETIKDRARLMLGVVDQMRISTIHSFCRSILKSHPLEAQLHPQFDIDADGSKAKRVVHDVLVGFFYDELRNRSESGIRTIFEAGISLEKVRDDIIRAVQSKNVPFPNPITHDNLNITYQSIIEHIHTLQPYFDKVPTNARSTHQHDIIALLQLCGILQDGISKIHRVHGRIEHEQELIAWVQSSPKAINRIKTWSKAGKVSKKLSEKEREEVAELCLSLRSYLDQLKYYRPSLLVHAVELFNKLIPKVRQKLKEKGIVSFTDLLQKTAILLQKNEEIAEQLRTGIDLLLVDEFQDTSIDQCDIIEILGLQKNRQYPKLFIVGDPKQSIYGWLNADISSYFSFTEKIEHFYSSNGMKGQSWRLTANFRSLSGILNAVEDTFSGYMNTVSQYQASFSPLDCMRAEESAPFPSVEVWTAWPEHICSGLPDIESPKAAQKLISSISALDALEEEAQAIARDIVTRNQEKNVPWKECAILFRSTTNLDRFLDALKRYQIPYAVTRDKNYYRRREVIEAHALLSCIFFPLDQISLIGVLRSSMVAIPDAALFLLWKHGFPEVFAYLEFLSDEEYIAMEAKLRSIQPQIDRLACGIDGYDDMKHWMDSVCHFLRSIRRLRQEKDTIPVDELIAKVRSYIGFSFSEVRAYQGNYRLANLDRFFYTVQKHLEDYKGDWKRVLDTLSQSIRDGEDEEEARPADPNQDAVQIMTIHKSKGLDFSHVYVVELHRSSGNSSGDAFYSGMVGSTQELALLGMRTLGYGEEQKRKKDVATFERLRLLYVAMTRAKNRLVLSGRFPAYISSTTQEQASLLSQHVQGLFIQNGIADLWERPSSADVVVRYLGDDSSRAAPASSQVRGAPSVAVLKKHQQLMENPLIDQHQSYTHTSLAQEQIPFDAYVEVEHIFVPLMHRPTIIEQSKKYVIRKLSYIDTMDFSVRDLRASLFELIPRTPSCEIVWHNRVIPIGNRVYRVHRLEKRSDGLCVVEYVFLESVRGESLMVSWNNDWSEECGILYARDKIQETFNVSVSAEIWGIQSQRRWTVTEDGIVEQS